MQGLCKNTQAGRDALRLVDDGFLDQASRLFRCDGRNIIVNPGGSIIGVRTSGILMVVNEIPVSLNSQAAQRENASSAAFEATYAEKRGALVKTPMEEILIT